MSTLLALYVNALSSFERSLGWLNPVFIVTISLIVIFNFYWIVAWCYYKNYYVQAYCIWQLLCVTVLQMSVIPFCACITKWFQCYFMHPRSCKTQLSGCIYKISISWHHAWRYVPHTTLGYLVFLKISHTNLILLCTHFHPPPSFRN